MSQQRPAKSWLLIIGCFGMFSFDFGVPADGRQVAQYLGRIEPTLTWEFNHPTKVSAGAVSTNKSSMDEEGDCQSSPGNCHPRSQSSVDRMWTSRDSNADELDAIHDAAELSLETVAESCSLSATTRDYCRQMSVLLSRTLTPINTEIPQNKYATQQALEAAMLLVAETTSAQAELKIARLNSEHAHKMEATQQDFQQRYGQSAIANQPPSNSLQTFIAPVVAKLTQTQIQLVAIAKQQAELQGNVTRLQEKFERANALPPQVIHNPLFRESAEASAFNTALQPMRESATSVRPDIEQDLQRQIAQLQMRLEEVRQHQARSARQLEPQYTPDRPLLPLYQR